MDELLMERYALAKERVCEIKEEKAVQMPYLDFFQKTAAFLEKNVEIMDGVVFLGETREPRKLADAADLSIDEWKELNRDLYADILPENYKNSYGNPVYACETGPAAKKAGTQRLFERTKRKGTEETGSGTCGFQRGCGT